MSDVGRSKICLLFGFGFNAIMNIGRGFCNIFLSLILKVFNAVWPSSFRSYRISWMHIEERIFFRITLNFSPLWAYTYKIQFFSAPVVIPYSYRIREWKLVFSLARSLQVSYQKLLVSAKSLINGEILLTFSTNSSKGLWTFSCGLGLDSSS